jgi:predicted house-cleaning noncanonical NTP pyrophosphatase (MazG superfamily)
MTRKFSFKKLVRDKIVDSIKDAGGKPSYHKLNNKSFVGELKKKLVEEALEIPSETDRDKLLQEIADVQEVIDSLIDVLKSSKKEIQKIQKIKNQKIGSFKKRLYIEQVEVNKDSKWINYYLANPDKYPESLG